MGTNDKQLTKSNLGFKGQTPNYKQGIDAKEVLKKSKLDLNGLTPDKYSDNIVR